MNAVAPPDVRDALLRYARRRLPREDAEDVVQQALCDALASGISPETPSEHARLLMTIVKRRVVDWFRARKITAPIDDEVAGTTPENALLARDLLQHIDREVSSTDRRTLDWIVREHEGENLSSIAAQEHFSAAAVRQRIHRLRSSLRAHHYAIAMALLLGLGIFAAKTHQETISMDPAGVLVGDARGRYLVESLEITRATSADRVLLESFRHARVRAEGDRIIIEGSAKSITLFVLSRPTDDSIVVRSSQGSERLALHRLSTGDLVITTNGRFSGELRLRRE